MVGSADRDRDGAGTLRAPRIYAATDCEQPEYYRFLNAHIAAYTSRSPAKESANEDAMAVIPVDHDAGVLIVADGVGGMPQGSSASRIAVQTLVDALSGVHNTAQMREAILDGIEQANRSILESRSGAAATLCVAEISGTTVRPYHVGDALVLITGQRGRLKFQNIPHSPVGYAVEAGLLHEDDAVHHEERNLVSNVVGDGEMRIDVGPAIDMAARDTLLLASDGLADNLYIDEIVNHIRVGRLPGVAEKLSQACRRRMTNPNGNKPAHPDDLSFLIMRRDGLSRAAQISMAF